MTTEEWIAFIPTALVGARTYLAYHRTARFLARASFATGRITGFTRKQTQQMRRGGGTHTWHYPQVEFTLKDGTRVEFESAVYQVHPTGYMEPVRVAYDPADPARTAVIATELAWRSTIRWGLVTAVVLALTLGAKYC
jgi:hypothetical protein